MRISKKELLQFIYDLLVTKHGENENYDYMLNFAELIKTVPGECSPLAAFTEDEITTAIDEHNEEMIALMAQGNENSQKLHEVTERRNNLIAALTLFPLSAEKAAEPVAAGKHKKQ